MLPRRKSTSVNSGRPRGHYAPEEYHRQPLYEKNIGWYIKLFGAMFAVGLLVYLASTQLTTNAKWEIHSVMNETTNMNQLEASSGDTTLVIHRFSEGHNGFYVLPENLHQAYAAEIAWADGGVHADISMFHVNSPKVHEQQVYINAELPYGWLLVSPNGEFASFFDENGYLAFFNSNQEKTTHLPIKVLVFEHSFSPSNKYFLATHITEDGLQALFLVDLTAPELKAVQITNWSKLWLDATWIDGDTLVVTRYVPKTRDALVQTLEVTTQQLDNVVSITDANPEITTTHKNDGSYQVRIQSYNTPQDVEPLVSVIETFDDEALALTHQGTKVVLWQN